MSGIEWVLLLPWPLINEVSDKYEIENKILAAFVATESMGKACATRYEPKYRWTKAIDLYAKRNSITSETEKMHQMTSWGMMQVMGGTARDLNYEDNLTNLCNPRVGLELGARYLKKLLNKYDNFWDAVASYNAGSPRKTPEGMYQNQSYVDKIEGYIDHIDFVKSQGLYARR